MMRSDDAISGGPDDGRLLAVWRSDQNAEAFAQVVRRHAPMVFGVCRSILGDGPDAHDATQAVFLALVRKAASLEHHPTLAGWLHRVACYVSIQARRAATVRRRHEREAARMRSTDTAGSTDLPADLLHEAIGALADKYRVPIVLHHLEGRSEEEIASLLGCSLGTLSSRLSRGRQKLRQRLTKLGAGVTAGVMAAALTQSATAAAEPLPAALLTSLVHMPVGVLAGQASATVASASAVTLSKGAIHMLFMAKMKLAAMVTAAVMLVGGLGVTTYVAVAAERPTAPAQAPAQAPAPGEVTLHGQVFTQTGSNKLCDPDMYPLVMNVKTPQRVEMYFLKASDLTRQFAREVAAKGAMQVVVVGKVAKEGIYDAVTVSRIEVADAATQPAARAAAAEKMPMAEMVKGEKVLVKFWHYPLVDHPNRPSDDDIAAGRKKIGDKIAQALKAANVEAVRFLWGQNGQEGADRSSYSAMVLLDCKGVRPEKALAGVPCRIAGIVFKDGAYERALPVQAESKWLITAKKGQVPARYAFYSRGGSAFAELQQGQRDVERFGKMAELRVDAIPPLPGASGGGWSAKLTPAKGHTLLEVFILTDAGFQLVEP